MTIRLLFRLIRRTAALSLLGVAAATAEPPTPSPAGRWDAIITANGVDVPFTFEIAGSGQTLRGLFFNGERRVTSTGSQFENDSLSLRFDQYGATLQLTYRDEQLTGEYIEHTVLLPGVPDQLNEKVPQAVNLNAFPTTFILGRDGRVRGVHAGFPSPGSGAFYKKATQDGTRQVERLLAERAGS